MEKTDSDLNIRILSIILFFFAGIFLVRPVQAQEVPSAGSVEIVQFSGVIVDDEGRQLPGVHIYVPKTGRGTTSNVYGYFSMPLLAGDSVVFSSIGYERFGLLVPKGRSRVNADIRMQADVTYLENVDITPFLSEEHFKEAILALQLPDQRKLLEERLDGDVIAMMARSAPYDAALNAQFYLNQTVYYQQDKFVPRSNPFLNPFNWANFIKSLKK